jgi:hypothetical protein
VASCRVLGFALGERHDAQLAYGRWPWRWRCANRIRITRVSTVLEEPRRIGGHAGSCNGWCWFYWFASG